MQTMAIEKLNLTNMRWTRAKKHMTVNTRRHDPNNFGGVGLALAISPFSLVSIFVSAEIQVQGDMFF